MAPFEHRAEYFSLAIAEMNPLLRVQYEVRDGIGFYVITDIFGATLDALLAKKPAKKVFSWLFAYTCTPAPLGVDEPGGTP